MNATLSASRRQPKPPPPPRPVAGSCRWCGAPTADDLRDGTALLLINGNPYWCEGLTSAAGSLLGIRLAKADGTAIYDVRLDDGAACDCPDYLFRRCGRDAKGCKHLAALRVALPRLDAA